ncbi:peptidase inhibitor family I36 protein [Actinocorallia sp. A-T 12471]|uniref:peptidase inhibitor family I36 protein n=1 Tax=Actinocorallia sp. A-T 12471 TaxID=3089813 RepID=UPI0029CD7327|nr:peptidase inhibitor family I36 protein [Actinocorallia sp. A-T 12471]MDX6742001.1 peptidase inhibitor family I36 protein [Actinocorallia sp. A-T 12471]
MTSLNKVLAATAGVLALGGTVLVTASPASAATRNGVCQTGEFCYYFNSGNKGSVSDFSGSVADYGTKQPSCYDFKGAGNGKGKCIKNEAASVWNRSSKTVRVYYNSGYKGSYQDFKPGAKGNLSKTLKNQNASHKFNPSASTPSGKTNMSTALYKASGGYISCGFDGYTTTPGRHEGIDFVRGLNSNVYSLTAGTVINVKFGRTGSGGLSTIAIYNASLKKTVIYLHTKPRASLRVGQSIKKGQVIADESWRGVGSSGATHTHVEVRNGKQKLAAPSVGDAVLSNPNPNSFWVSQGYAVK